MTEMTVGKWILFTWCFKEHYEQVAQRLKLGI